MRIRIKKQDVVSRADFKPSDIETVFTNKDKREVAFVKKNYAVVINDDDGEDIEESRQGRDSNPDSWKKDSQCKLLVLFSSKKDGKDNMTGQNCIFDTEQSIIGHLKSAGHVAIDNSYQLIDYLDLFRASIIHLIEDGHIFDDYMESRFLIEDPYMPDRSEEEWRQVIKNAYEKKGLDLDEIERQMTGSNVDFAMRLKEVVESMDFSENTRMGDLIGAMIESDPDCCLVKDEES